MGVSWTSGTHQTSQPRRLGSGMTWGLLPRTRCATAWNGVDQWRQLSSNKWLEHVFSNNYNIQYWIYTGILCVYIYIHIIYIYYIMCIYIIYIYNIMYIYMCVYYIHNIYINIHNIYIYIYIYWRYKPERWYGSVWKWMICFQRYGKFEREHDHWTSGWNGVPT